MKKPLFLALILSLGLFLRFSRLTDTPPSLNWDEVSHGYNAYSLLKTGQDEWGQPFPLANFRAYGDYPLAANLYLTLPSISLFGLNEFGLRAPHAFLGTLTILASFFLATGLGFNPVVGLLTALFVALDPWTLFPSRFVVQSNLSFFFITAGLACFFHRRKKTFFLPLAALAFGISAYSYHNARIFTPLLTICLAFIYRKEWSVWWLKKKKSLTLTLLLLALFFLPLFPILLGPEARARASWVGLIDQGAINQIIESRLRSNLSPLLTRLLYNRPTYFLKHFFLNYFSYFSPQFLFFQGGTQYQFSVPGKGVLYPLTLPFFYLGLYLLFKNRQKKFAPALLAWLLLAPIPAAITQGRGHLIRATTLLPLPQILIALGLFQTKKVFQKKAKKIFPFFSIAFFLILSLSVFSYLQIYFGSYRQAYSWSWQYGYKQVAAFVKNNYQDYGQILITKKYGEPHEFLLFYLAWDPAEYRTDPNLIRYFKSDWYWVDSFAKFIFINDWEIKERTQEPAAVSQLLITSPGNYPKGWEKIQTVYFLDQKPAFEILKR